MINKIKNQYNPDVVSAPGETLLEILQTVGMTQSDLAKRMGRPIKTVNEISKIITVEEHQVGGFGNIVAGILAQGKAMSKPLAMDMIGINDRFGESGSPWDLMKSFELTAEHISVRAKKLFDVKAWLVKNK